MSRALRDLITELGIDPRLSEAETAAVLVRELPLRAADAGETGPESMLHRRWCPGIGVWAAFMEAWLGVAARWGSAFGCRWPWFEKNGALTAPALPVRLTGSDDERGPDGVYGRMPDSVIREAGGRTRPMLALETQDESATPAWDLLWFTPAARWIVSRGALEIEDLFSTTVCAVDRARLDRLLVRSKRIDPSVLDGLDFESGAPETTIAVTRATKTERLPEPEVLLGARMDVESAASRGDHIELVDIHREPSTFAVEAMEDGYRLTRRAGSFLFDAFELRRADDGVRLHARLPAGRDLFKPGLRERLVFDLHADLGACLGPK